MKVSIVLIVHLFETDEAVNEEIDALMNSCQYCQRKIARKSNLKLHKTHCEENQNK